MIPIVLSVIISEVFVDCVKHAFITKFNDISPDVYQRYRFILSKDMTTSRSARVSVCECFCVYICVCVCVTVNSRSIIKSSLFVFVVLN